VLLERAKELGFCKDIYFVHIKVRGREHYGQAEGISFNRKIILFLQNKISLLAMMVVNHNKL
jgi:phage anti-repressor protein